MTPVVQGLGGGFRLLFADGDYAFEVGGQSGAITQQGGERGCDLVAFWGALDDFPPPLQADECEGGETGDLARPS